MKISLLTVLGVIGLFFVSLSPSALHAYATLSPQQFSLPYLGYIPVDSIPVDQEWGISRTSAREDRMILFDLVQELRALPVGKQYSYYRQALEQQGYIVLSNYNDTRHWEFALEKKDQNLRLTIAYNAGTGKSTAITASGPRIADVERGRGALEDKYPMYAFLGTPRSL